MRHRSRRWKRRGRSPLFAWAVMLIIVAILWSRVVNPRTDRTPATQPVATQVAQRDQLLEGVIDFHVHSGPDVVGRLINDFEVVRQAKGAGMRAIVLKNHYTMTADRAQLAMQEIGGIEVFGGITLNLSVGGLNAEAVRKMVQMDGRRGRVVWLPTYDAEAQVKQSGEDRAFVAVVKDGAVVPELKVKKGQEPFIANFAMTPPHLIFQAMPTAQMHARAAMIPPAPSPFDDPGLPPYPFLPCPAKVP